MLSNRRDPINRLRRAGQFELKPNPLETPIERFEALGERFANPDLEMDDYDLPKYWLQRHGLVDEIEYKGSKRLFSVMGRFAIPDPTDRESMELNWLRVHLLDPETHQSVGHSEVLNNELDGDPRKLHRRLDVIECGIMAIELNQGIIDPKLIKPLLISEATQL